MRKRIERIMIKKEWKKKKHTRKSKIERRVTKIEERKKERKISMRKTEE